MSSQVSPSVSQKPPLLPEGVNALWAWLWAALTISDNALLNSAGLDAWVTKELELQKSFVVLGCLEATLPCKV